jgi:tetratricopeptide (TPR) repeat protein
LARRGLELNPLATGLWNVLGDCELHARRPRAALACYERAIALNPREVRGRYNAAYAMTARRDDVGALRMIADTMALDDGSHRDRLLGKQARILDRLARRHARERDRSRDRFRPSPQ